MKIEIKEYCVRCGICTALYPELFARNHEKDCIEAKCEILEEEQIARARSAAQDCAVTAIYLKQ